MHVHNVRTFTHTNVDCMCVGLPTALHGVW